MSNSVVSCLLFPVLSLQVHPVLLRSFYPPPLPLMVLTCEKIPGSPHLHNFVNSGVGMPGNEVKRLASRTQSFGEETILAKLKTMRCIYCLGQSLQIAQ